MEKYKLEEYDSYELLKRSGAKLPIDNLQFIDPILDFEDEFEKVLGLLETVNRAKPDRRVEAFLKGKGAEASA